jgi:excisionase family DNA binding protein
MTNDFLTVAQAADELNLSVRAVQHRIRNGSIEATKLGDGRTSAYVITRAEINRVKAGPTAAPAAS